MVYYTTGEDKKVARIRTIKPEFWTDGDLLRVSRDTRLFYIGLWNFSDDNGVLEYDPMGLKAKIFPIDKIDIEKLITELSSIGKVILYEVNNRKYLYLKNLSNHQIIDRPRKSHLPLPEENQLKSIEISSIRKEGKEGKEGKEYPTQEFFDYFLLKTKKSYRLSPERKKIIETRLNDHSLEELKRAVDNFVLDDWPDRHKYIDIVYCIGTRNKIDNLEKWLNATPPKPKYRCPC